ncbi:thiamine-phosphate kinase [Janibacter hoylei]|uniref:thiamine-phosphate kinase n=1 Tax=Janibacter hoylei TaxID=364298 RepID=UPI002AA2ACBF|nr:AIR synthase related protein [Janibacter hoylei]
MPRTRLRDLTEGELLEQLFPRFGGITGPAAVPLGPGDDAAVLAAPSGSVVLTTDSMVRGRDWRDDWSSAREVGLKVVAQNIADIAAMGAVPTGLLVALAADPETEVAWALELAEGIAQAAGEAGAPVLGGDLSSAASGTVVVAITATGDLEGRPPVRRDGARPGDVVAVRGGLGRSGEGCSSCSRVADAPTSTASRAGPSRRPTTSASSTGPPGRRPGARGPRRRVPGRRR